MSEMKLTIYAEPDDFILATRAAKALLASKRLGAGGAYNGTIFEFENGDTFYAYYTKNGSVVARKLPPKGEAWQ